MNKHLRQQLDKYYKDISLNLPCGGNEKRTMLHTLKSSIDSYVGSNSTATMTDIIEQFGSSQSFVDAYIDSKNPREIENYYRKQKNFRLTAISTIAFLLFIISFGVYMFVRQNNYYDSRQATMYVTESDVKENPSNNALYTEVGIFINKD